MVQTTNVMDVLFGVDCQIASARASGHPLLVKQSDLSNCFTRLDCDVAKKLAVWHGMRPRHAELFFGLNRSRPAVVKAGAACGDWFLPERGMAHGDPVSPLAAALYSAAHTAVPHSAFLWVFFKTYVDDRTVCTHGSEEMHGVVFLLTELDYLSGQAEDPYKEEWACVMPDQAMQEQFPQARTQYLDLLGIRINLGGGPPSLAPKAAARRTEVHRRLDRLQKFSRGLHVGEAALQKVVAGTMSLLRFDAAWIETSFEDCFSLASKVEPFLQNRRRYAAWRHRGASWVMITKVWQVEPVAIQTFAVVSAARSLQSSPWSAALREACNDSSGVGGLFADTLRDAYARLKWGHTDSPFVFLLPQGKTELGMISEACLGHLLRQGWRKMVMQNHLSFRHVPVDVHTIDVHPLHQFVGGATPSERALAWRCTVAAEPNAERMSHVAGVNVEAGCPWCPAERGTTMHIMWECPSAEALALRAKHSISFSEAEDFAVGRPRAAFLQNGWAPAPVPVRAADSTFQSHSEMNERA